MAIFDPKIFDLRIFDTPVAGRRKRRQVLEHNEKFYWVDSAQEALDLLLYLKEQERKQNNKLPIVKRRTEKQFNKELKKLILKEFKRTKSKNYDDDMEFIELMMIA